jgi:hypothetical protein
LQHLALVAHYVYGSSDLAHLCLVELVGRAEVSAKVPQEYLLSLSA